MKRQFRDAISATGSFVSIPEAFPGADPGVIMAPKVELRVARFSDSKHPLKFEPVMYPHQILIDLEAVDSGAFDAGKVIKDCELVIEAAKSHPEKLRQILAAFAEDAPHSRMLEAANTAEKLGLAESEIADKGGGLVLLLVVVAALAMSSCKGCAHARGHTRQS